MENGQYFLYNDQYIIAGKAVITADNRSFRFGDGFFETMKMVNGNILLDNLHFERLFASLELLKFEKPDYFTAAYLLQQIRNIAVKNSHEKSARIRLNIFRGDGSLYDYENDLPNYIIQTWKLNNESFELNKNGLHIGIYKNAKKSCDDFSSIKSNNYLPYLMGANWAKENKLDDAIVLNNYNHIADATIANVFFVKDGKIKTPALSEGCVDGVMRKFLLQSIKKENIPVEETAITFEELTEANEIFLTNAVQGIRWVKQCDNYNYNLQLAVFLYNKFLLPLF